ncbi:MAG: ORC1-type DNA replication protein [Candidatus Hodarchaeota archaeon]
MNAAKNALDDVFDAFLDSPKIFANREALTCTHIPSTLPHREGQIRQLGQRLACVLRGSRPSNVFIYGKSGTGKTAVVKYVVNGLKKRASSLNFSVNFAYVNCRLVDTHYRVLANLCNSLGEEVPFTGLPTDAVYNRFCEAVEKKKGLFIIILDEIDALVKKNGDESLYNLTRINTRLEHAQVSLIGISNELNVKEYLSSQVLSSLSEEEIIFPPYSAQNLQDILTERVAIAFEGNIVLESAVNLIAALAAREHGDARRAIDLLRIAGEIAERESSTTVTDAHVQEARTTLENKAVQTALNTLPLQSKLILGSIFILENNEEKIQNLNTGEVYAQYCMLCSKIGSDSLTQRRVSDLLTELDDLGIISAKVVSNGRYGRSKVIKTSISKIFIREMILQEKFQSSFSN